MDNLTHSLVGAVLAQAGLKKKTGLAMPTLIIAANLPDIDAACAVYGIESLAMRRGVTHGPIALLLLPLLLWGLMIAFDRWQERRGKRPATRLPVHEGWLLALAYIGCFSHPALDWLNNYGIRLLEPFSHRWFYGDTLFIIDLWIWAALGVSVWLSLRRERRGAANWQRPAGIGLAAVAIYIFANGLITGAAENMAADALRASGKGDALVVASPPPLTFWKRDIFWRTADRYGSASFIPGVGGHVDISGTPTGLSDPRLTTWVKADPAARAFLFWARMPVAEVDGDAILLRDQRYMQPLARDRFTVRVTAPDTASHP
ncbi:metal-dependent hydrolase [Sphingopyxis macrogoltabida]|uniref:Metal-dependent hydrolase n=1 Tax=Sphingopyxis macrogoltabida TaxID=33050 RepID=A0AAC9AVD1_SPHMC|nr:metal-dependent hydrolase [Sphingopyxis macrogoltabida]ALJ12922.1 membrane-bound metal-dependent hydrolase [Sphingopyxis macrogoltabida]AMU89611.1 metal-dependent hydrolase [Sphingopyxis macrogoltabida]